MTKRILNWRPERPDHRDFYYSVRHSEARKLIQLPPSVDLRSYCPPVVDQGEIGSCTGNGIANALGYLQLSEIRAGLPLGKSPQEYTQNLFEPISRLFIYYNERMEEGDTGQDGGAIIRDGINAVRYYGACRESTWLYDTTQVFNKPSDAAYQEAQLHKSIYHYKLTPADFDRCLAHQYPFVFGVTVYDSFLSDQVAQTGIVPLPGAYENVAGGHCMLCVGYILIGGVKYYVIDNSWGTGWGDQGFGYMPEKYLANPNLCTDCWTIRRLP